MNLLFYGHLLTFTGNQHKNIVGCHEGLFPAVGSHLLKQGMSFVPAQPSQDLPPSLKAHPYIRRSCSRTYREHLLPGLAEFSSNGSRLTLTRRLPSTNGAVLHHSSAGATFSGTSVTLDFIVTASIMEALLITC